MVAVGLQRPSVHLQYEIERATTNSETAMGGRYATGPVVLTPGAVYATTGQSVMALTDRVHSDEAIAPGQKYCLPMIQQQTSHIIGPCLLYASELGIA
jgi:hypothetical protein